MSKQSPKAITIGSYCSIVQSNFFSISINFSCAFYTSEGGPLVYKGGRSNSEPQCLIGVASFSVISQDQTNITSVFTSASTFIPFIRKKLALFSAPSKCEILK